MNFIFLTPGLWIENFNLNFKQCLSLSKVLIYENQENFLLVQAGYVPGKYLVTTLMENTLWIYKSALIKNLNQAHKFLTWQSSHSRNSCDLKILISRIPNILSLKIARALVLTYRKHIQTHVFNPAADISNQSGKHRKQ